MEQRTPPPAENSASAECRLKRFVDKIKKPRTPALLQLPSPEQPEATPWPKIPTRSRRIAAQSLSHIPASKRGEFLVRKQLEHTKGQAELASMAKIFGDYPEHMQALRELFPPEGDVGARKRRRQLRMKTVELGRKTPQPFSTFTFEIRKRKRKRTSRTRKRTRTYGIS